MNNVTRFLSEVKSELSRVIWPSFDEWVGSTIIVLILILAFAVFLGVVDAALSELAKKVFGF